ncbi:extracellular solute-binding protein [Georgenia ruanii]|uniref:Extracellular solute-binding protein n=1 Tax=Georgenia ruanii TaxID=348442 RepID=A0A7J9UYF5_9MICO|nr:extracellular solute-binding protein [Georgenia ruanii]MPV89657.1 extracellular solute-binding protein [Georgenia ruanii]
MPTNRRRPLVIGATLTALALTLAACSAAEGEEPGAAVATAADVNQCEADGTTLTVTYNSLATEPMEHAVAKLGEKYPGLEIDEQVSASTSYPELTQQIVADIAVGKRPDLIMTGLGQLPFWVSEYNPTEFDTSVLADTYQEQFLGAGTIDGKVYLAPAQISSPAMAVNQDLLDAAGAGKAADIKTYDDLLEVAKKVTDHTGKPSVSIPPQGLPEWFSQGLVQNSGGTLVAEDGSAAFGDDTGVAALDIWSELARQGLEAGLPHTSDALNAFGTGDLAVSMITTSNIAALKESVGDGFEWMPIHVPSVDGETGRPMPAGGNGWIVLSEDACRAAFASELVGEILSPEAVMLASGTQRSYIPVDTEARDELLASPEATPQMEFAWLFDTELTPWGGFDGAHTAEVNDALLYMVEQLQAGTETKAAVDQAVSTINSIVGTK